MTLSHGKQLREFMRNRAEVLKVKIDGRGRMSDFKYKVQSMEAHPSGFIRWLVKIGSNERRFFSANN